MTRRDPLLNLALSMYANEPCRICGRMLTMDDIKNGAVFAGYSDDGSSRSAHKKCWDGAMETVMDFLDKRHVARLLPDGRIFKYPSRD